MIIRAIGTVHSLSSWNMKYDPNMNDEKHNCQIRHKLKVFAYFYYFHLSFIPVDNQEIKLGTSGSHELF